jgi:hypothetical protein
MHDLDLYGKTPAGFAEMRDRSQKLAPRLRTMLIMVDGTRSVAQLRQAAQTLAAPADFLDVLLAKGLVVLEPAAVAQPLQPADPGSLAVPPAVTDALPEGGVPLPGESDATDRARFGSARTFLIDSAVELLGFRAFLFTMKLDRCFTPRDLLALLPDFSKSIAKSHGPEMARTVEERVHEMLQAPGRDA